MVSDSIRGQVSVKMGRYFYPCRHSDLLRVTKKEFSETKEAEKCKGNQEVFQTIADRRENINIVKTLKFDIVILNLFFYFCFKFTLGNF